MSSEDEHSSKDIVEAKKGGIFLEYISNASLGKQQNRDQIGELLVSLHNGGEIDIISEFEKLENRSDSAGDFFLAIHILEKALPYLSASIRHVMDCVQHLTNEAGQDLAAGRLIQPFTEFCEADPERVDEALGYILSAPESYGSLLPPALIAGTSHDMEISVTKAIGFSSHDNVDIRSNAVFALGRIPFPSDSAYPREIIERLASACESEVNDQVLSNIVRTVCNVLLADNTQIDKGADILSSALQKGDEITLHTASHIFGYETKNLPEQLLNVLLLFLIDVNPEHAGTLSNIGFGITRLLKRDDPEQGIDFLEHLLLKHKGKLTIDSLNHLVHSISKQEISLLNKLMTKWLLTGEYVLCDSISTIVDINHTKEPQLKIDPVEIPPDNPILNIFIAHKAIGFLFMKPVTCASILLSLMEASQSEDVLHDIGMLLFDPILLNFSGKPYDFLQEEYGKYSEPVNREIQKAIDAIDTYLNVLRSVPSIPELYPTQEQREVQLRNYNRQVAESYEEAQNDSIFNLICSKSVLLYGKSSIMHIYDGLGKSNRMEIPMQSHSVSFEIPRQADIAPFDFDFKLRMFRNERLVAQ